MKKIIMVVLMLVVMSSFVSAFDALAFSFWKLNNNLNDDYTGDTASQVGGSFSSTEFAIFSLASALGAMAGGWALDNSGLDVQGILRVLIWTALIPGILWGLWVFFGKQAEPEAVGAGID